MAFLAKEMSCSRSEILCEVLDELWEEEDIPHAHTGIHADEVIQIHLRL